MSRTISILALFVILASCKKKYNCACTTTQNVMGYNQKVNSTVTTEKMKEDEARAYCSSLNASNNAGNVQQNVSCTFDGPAR